MVEELIHYSEIHHRNNNEHACGKSIQFGDKIAWHKHNEKKAQSKVTCPKCIDVITKLRRPSCVDKTK